MSRLFLAVLLLGYSAASAIRYPVSPAEPVVKGSEKKKNNQSVRNVAVTVRLKLGSGDELEGTISLPENISFTHLKNGLTYSKTIRPTQIKKIIINEYTTRRSSSSFIEFEPQSITLTTTDGREFVIDGIFSFLKKIAIDTPDGTATVYTIFADSWNDKSGWSEVASKDRNYHRHHPHPQAVREIHVLGAPAPSGEPAAGDE